MRIVLIAAVTLLASAMPVLADDASDLATAKAAIAAAKLSAASDLDMWCGAAMVLVSQATKDSDPTKSKAADTNANAFYTKASASLTADGVNQGDFAAISQDFVTLASAQLVAGTEPLSHSTDDCVL